MQIQEGRLVEQPCPHCGELERRAFGEVESDRGELASYAIGWTSGHEDRVGHMTIGIGAGNPGGGSFHIEVRTVDGEPGMMLVDRPFENVPEGGPDLTREEGLANEAVDFVWFVADNVMFQDRRAWWMQYYLSATGAIVTRPVAAGTAPVLHIVRDDDGAWQLRCATPGGEDDQTTLHLFHALDRDPALLEVLDLEPGERADRDGPDRPWERGKA